MLIRFVPAYGISLKGGSDLGMLFDTWYEIVFDLCVLDGLSLMNKSCRHEVPGTVFIEVIVEDQF